MKPLLTTALLLFILGANNTLLATDYTLVASNPGENQVANESGAACTLTGGDALKVPSNMYNASRVTDLVTAVTIETAADTAATISFNEAGWRQINLSNLTGSGNLIFNGNTGTGGYYSIFALNGTSALSGTIELRNANAGIIQINLGTREAVAGAVVDLSTGAGNTSATAVLHLASDATVAGLKGTRTTARVTSTNGEAKTLTLNVAGAQDLTYAGSIGQGNYGTNANGTGSSATGTIALVKQGAGTQRLTGGLTVSAIDVQEGILDVTGSTGLGASHQVAISLGSASASGILQGLSITDANKGNLLFSTTQAGGTLADLSVSFNTTATDWSACNLGGNTVIDGLSLTLSGNLSQVGETVNLLTGATLRDDGSITLNYNGNDAVMNGFVATVGRNEYTLSSSADGIALTLTSMGAYDLVWNGSEADMTWQVGGANWLHGADGESYQPNDNVTFTETGAGTVTISGVVGGGSLNVTGGEYTFINNTEVAGSGLAGGGGIHLSGNANVVFSGTVQSTGAVSLSDTAALTFDIASLGSVSSVQLNGADTKLTVSTAGLTSPQILDLVSKVQGNGTLALALRADGSNYTRINFSDKFTGVAEISGFFGIAGDTWSSSWNNDAAGPVFRMKSGKLYSEGTTSVDMKNGIDVAGNFSIQLFNDNADMTLSGAITGGSSGSTVYTITKQGTGTLQITSSLADYSGRLAVALGTLSLGTDAWNTYGESINVTGGRLEFTGAAAGNALSSQSAVKVNGGTAVYGDHVSVVLTGDGSAEASQLRADGGKLVFKNNVQVAGGAVQSGSGAARITAKDAGAVTYSNVTVDSFNGLKRTDGATSASIRNGLINVTKNGAYVIENMELVNSLVQLSNAGSLTLTNVTLGGGTKIERLDSSAKTLSVVNSTLILGSANRTNPGSTGESPLQLTYSLAGASVSGSFTLGLTDELMLAVGAWEGGPYNHVTITLTDVNGWTVDASDIHFDGYTNDFNPENVTVTDNASATGGTVEVSFSLGKPIPEPSAAALGLAALGGLLLRRRRRRAL